MDLIDLLGYEFKVPEIPEVDLSTVIFVTVIMFCGYVLRKFANVADLLQDIKDARRMNGPVTTRIHRPAQLALMPQSESEEDGEDQTRPEIPSDNEQCKSHPFQARPKSRQYSPFLKACLNGDLAKLKHLVANGSNPCETYPRTGETGLMLCVYSMAKGFVEYNPKCLQFLLDAGCPINAQSAKGLNTALHMAVKAGNISVILWLVINGADPYQANKKGWNAAAIAIATGNKDIIKAITSQPATP